MSPENLSTTGTAFGICNWVDQGPTVLTRHFDDFLYDNSVVILIAREVFSLKDAVFEGRIVAFGTREK